MIDLRHVYCVHCACMVGAVDLPVTDVENLRGKIFCRNCTKLYIHTCKELNVPVTDFLDSWHDLTLVDTFCDESTYHPNNVTHRPAEEATRIFNERIPGINRIQQVIRALRARNKGGWQP